MTIDISFCCSLSVVSELEFQSRWMRWPYDQKSECLYADLCCAYKCRYAGSSKSSTVYYISYCGSTLGCQKLHGKIGPRNQIKKCLLTRYWTWFKVIFLMVSFCFSFGLISSPLGAWLSNFGLICQPRWY